LHRLGVGDVEAGETLLDPADVELQRREEVIEQRAEVNVRPSLRELEPVGDLVQRHPRPKIGLGEAPVPFERRDVGDHEEHRPGAASRHRDVVLPEHALAEVAENLPHLGSQQQGRELAHRLLELGRHPGHPPDPGRVTLVGVGPEAARGLLLRLRDRRADALGGGLQEILEALDVRLDPLRPADRSDGGDVGGRSEARELADLEFGQSNRLLHVASVLVRRRLILPSPLGGRDADLACELPVDGPLRGQEHALDLPHERDVGEHVAARHLEGVLGGPRIAHRGRPIAHGLMRTSYDRSLE
jgi:hypothetical protein